MDAVLQEIVIRSRGGLIPYVEGLGLLEAAKADFLQSWKDGGCASA